MLRASRLPPGERFSMLRKSNHSSMNVMRAAMHQKHAANTQDHRGHIQNRPSMSLSYYEQQLNRRPQINRFTPTVTLNHHTNLSMNERFALDKQQPPAARMRGNARRQRPAATARVRNSRRGHQPQQQHEMMEIDYQPPQSGLKAELIQRQADLNAQLGKKSDIRARLGRPVHNSKGTNTITSRAGGTTGQSRGLVGREGASGRAAPRRAPRRPRPQSGVVGQAHGEGGRGVGARGGSGGGDSHDSPGSGSDRRPGGFAGRGGRRRRRGRGGPVRTPLTREQLDSQLDSYMSKTKTHMDLELDKYMALAQKTST